MKEQETKRKRIETTKGNIWKSFNLNGETIRYTSINLIDTPLQDADVEGKPITKKQTQKAEYKFFYENGEEYTGTIKKVYEGEVVEKTELTKEVSKEDIKEVDLKKAYDLFNEHEYIVSVSPSFAEKLKDSDKAIQFPFNTGFGYKPQIAILFYDNVTKCFIMRTGRVLRSVIVNGILNTQAEKETAKQQLAEIQAKTKGKKLKVEDF